MLQQNIAENVVWDAIKGTSQDLALNSPAHVTLYTGTRGPGKTDVQLFHFRQYVGRGYGAFWRGVLFDLEYKNLDDIVTKSKRWFKQFNDGARFLESNAAYKWIWPTGEELLFRTVKTEADYWDYHGQEFPWQGWNELTKWPNLELFNMMLSTNRSSFTPEKDAPKDKEGKPTLGPIPLCVFATSNPFGVGHNAVKRTFIDPAPYGQVVRTQYPVFNPITQATEEIERTQVTIFGHWSENPFLSREYIAALSSQTNKNRRKAWLAGSWDIEAGGAFDDVYDSNYHLVPNFPIPASWSIDCGFDWGSTHPGAYLIFAEANGEEITLPTGETFAPPAGTIFVCGEIYFAEDIGTNKGLRLGAREQGRLIKEYVADMLADGWIPRAPAPGPADNQIRDVRESSTETIEEMLASEGAHFTVSDKSPGSRRNGLELLRERLRASTTGEGPGIYFMRRCAATIATLPVLPYDPKKLDDTDTNAEDHCYDVVRYRVLDSRSRQIASIQTSYAR